MKKAIIYMLCVSVLVFYPAGFIHAADTKASTADAKLSLDIKGMDILDVLKIISMKSGLNIVAGKNVTGRVTIFLKDVDVWDALELILAANNLAYEKRGNIINVMTDRDYELLYGEKFYDKRSFKIIKLEHVKAEDVSRALTQFKTNIGKVVIDEASNTLVIEDAPSKIAEMEQIVSLIDVPVETRVFSLQYSSAEDVLSQITEILTTNLGDARIDERTNKIIVRDTAEKVARIAEVIKEFDQKDRQVLIEAKILEIDLSDRYQMGIDWEFFFSKESAIKFQQELSLDPTRGGKLKVGTASGVDRDYSSLIELFQDIGNVNTLSSPKITAINNQESKILVGTRQPYATTSTVSSESTTTTAEQVTFVDVGIKLYVTPTINSDGYVTMKIKPEVSSVTDTYPIGGEDAGGNTVPVVSTTEAETAVMIKDGSTIIIAGLIKDKQDKTVRKVPIFGDIPVLGKLFQSIDDNKTKKEVVILLTPHIISGDKSIMDTADMVDIEPEPEIALSVSKDMPIEDNPASDIDAADYHLLVRQEIYQILQRRYPDSGIQGEALVSFIVGADGQLRGRPIVVREDDKQIGDLVVQCVNDAAPFNPFPNRMQELEQEIRILISLE